jgi:hypothetical protein
MDRRISEHEYQVSKFFIHKLIILTTVTLASSNNALPDDGDCTETCWSCFSVNCNVNFKIVFKTLKHFIVPTDALNNRKTQNCKIVKTIILAPTCFGSYKNYPQGAIQYYSLDLKIGVEFQFEPNLYYRSHAAITLTTSKLTSTVNPYL